jgi:hypothetical protein
LNEKVLPQDIFEGYGGRKQRLYSYATLIGVFNLIFAGFLLGAKGLGRTIPERVEAKDIALLGVATHKLSAQGARDRVLSSYRAQLLAWRARIEGAVLGFQENDPRDDVAVLVLRVSD